VDLQKAVDMIMRRTTEPGSEQMKQGQDNKLIPSGSVMLNLACSDSWKGGYGSGKIVNLIGDSSSGKTLLAFSMFAEMCRDQKWDGYDLIYDDVEQACEFPVEELFGKKTAERVIAPYYIQGLPQFSGTIQEWQANVMDAIGRGGPFVYVLDSFDALSSAEEQARAEKSVEAARSGKEAGGSYRMEKAKLSGEILRTILSALRSTGSLVVVISQTRDNIDPMSFTKKTRSGGNALRFYSSHEIWLAVKGKLKAKDRVIGSQIRARVAKNKLTGKLREVEFPIYYSYGTDDLGACVDFMLEEGRWQKKGHTIIAGGIGLEGTRQKLIQEIEEKQLASELFGLVAHTWRDIEEAIKLDRRKKFE